MSQPITQSVLFLRYKVFPFLLHASTTHPRIPPHICNTALLYRWDNSNRKPEGEWRYPGFCLFPHSPGAAVRSKDGEEVMTIGNGGMELTP